jgi:hypothetical protein
LGFKATAANLVTVPVYVFACLVTLAFAVLGDRLGHRGYRGYINLSVIPHFDIVIRNTYVSGLPTSRILFGTAFVGYLILIVSRSAALSYFAIYLAAA